jgi:hypothetical protein
VRKANNGNEPRGRRGNYRAIRVSLNEPGGNALYFHAAGLRMHSPVSDAIGSSFNHGSDTQRLLRIPVPLQDARQRGCDLRGNGGHLCTRATLVEFIRLKNEPLFIRGAPYNCRRAREMLCQVGEIVPVSL